MMALDDDYIFGSEFTQELRGLSRDNGLFRRIRPHGLLKQIAKQSEGVRVQAQFRFVKEHGRRPDRLKQRSRQTDEPKRSVRELVGQKRVIRIFLTPFQLNEVRILRQGTKLEIIEEGRGQAHGVPDSLVSAWISLSNSIKKRREILSVGTQRLIIVHLSLLANAR